MREGWKGINRQSSGMEAQAGDDATHFFFHYWIQASLLQLNTTQKKCRTGHRFIRA